MIKLARSQYRRIPNMYTHIIGILVFSFSFALISSQIPKFVTKYTPNESYYNILYMRVSDQQVKDCHISFEINRESYIDTDAQLTRRLIPIDYLQDTIQRKVNIIISHEDKGILIGKFPIPCDLPSGDYIFENLVEFEVDGFKKSTYYKSNTFEVKNNEQ